MEHPCEQIPLAPADLAAAWRRTRPPRRLVHLDSAAAARASWAVLDATAAHARREAEEGGYVAAAAAAPVLDRARDDVRALLGWPAGGGAVAFCHSAEDALRQVLLGLPGGVPTTAAHAPGEYGPNVALLRRLGVRPVTVDTPHRLDPAAFERFLAGTRPGLVHVTWVGSHVGTVQPAAEVAAVCAAAGVPVVLDAAQAFGHVDTALDALPADADVVVYGTSRKWLAGPRGVGFAAARGPLAHRLAPLEQAEAHVAGRVGLAAALAEHRDLGPAAVRAGLARVGTAVRHRLAAELEGTWEVVEELDEPSATATVRPTGGSLDPATTDLAALRARLLAEHGVLTTFAGVERSPGEMRTPALRVSGHLDTAAQDVDALVAALRAVA
ncbi:aminotransferase class V-fold PLP-dependent enzyme [Paenibacillus sp. TRM 82003]|uniref:aminotransferase class V-fold PLP-dependent enzyme n=1 Tax=Kineococcus sp. TRM81007 TaxID=2925831 RepID=UPI001F568C6B|nr:aminotransferase class V-fold PLP-dependent enzyme [Kineococcus sp. TRM81007]MCI2238525.1 aminotransferase class V-fold PLP-dependent enzyme [Kineococcus sp. TRM81007]MCI3921962.1 aminotransferase class V-fold PLP-dependent enzyme [Paenibacillus sp. TRM 82003]